MSTLAISPEQRRFELAAEVRLAPVTAAAAAQLAALLRTCSVTRLGSLSPEARGYAGHAVVGVLAHQAPLSAGRLAWTLIEVRTAANRPEASACAIVPAELGGAASVGQVVCLLSPAVSTSTSRTALLLRADKPGQVLLVGRARDCGRCAQCGVAVNLRHGRLCAAHVAASTVRVKCDRLDVASQAPRCQIVGLPVKQHRQLSAGVFRLDGARLAVDKHGRATLGALDGGGADDDAEVDRIARAAEEASERALLQRFPPQPKRSLGARYVQLVRHAAEAEQENARKPPAPPPCERGRAPEAARPPSAARPSEQPRRGGGGGQPDAGRGMGAGQGAGAARIAAELAAGPSGR